MLNNMMPFVMDIESLLSLSPPPQIVNKSSSCVREEMRTRPRDCTDRAQHRKEMNRADDDDGGR